ncbi:MAG: hypothetical protein LBR88_06865 [Zoogloeaceae bacterium]|jgi:hypothetical protein|nr:hypothetical protein [Zoogloeaceae bacterium]
MQTLPIFVHISKTSGSSTATLIGCNYAAGETHNITGGLYREKGVRVNPFDPKAVLDYVLRERKNLVRHKLISGHMPYGIHRILGVTPQYYVFLREPVALLLAHIRNVRRAVETRLKYDMLPPETEGYEFALKLLNCASPSEVLDMVLAPDFCPTGNAFRNLLTHYVSGCWFTEQVSLTQLNVAIDNLRASAFVGITEEFELSILMMAKKLKWRNVVPVLANQTPHSAKGQPFGREIPDEIRARLVRPLAYDQALYAVGQDIFHDAVKAEGTLLAEAAAQLKEIYQQLRRENSDLLYREERNLIDINAMSTQWQKIHERVLALNAGLAPASPLGRWQKICAAA